MSNKYYPYPLGLEEREPINKSISERLSRMTEPEVRMWEQEAHRLCMKELIDLRVKPTFPVLHARMKAKSIDC